MIKGLIMNLTTFFTDIPAVINETYLFKIAKFDLSRGFAAHEVEKYH